MNSGVARWNEQTKTLPMPAVFHPRPVIIGKKNLACQPTRDRQGIAAILNTCVDRPRAHAAETLSW
jgi:hypothetical protein